MANKWVKLFLDFFSSNIFFLFLSDDGQRLQCNFIPTEILSALKEIFREVNRSGVSRVFLYTQRIERNKKKKTNQTRHAIVWTYNNIAKLVLLLSLDSLHSKFNICFIWKIQFWFVALECFEHFFWPTLP